MDNIYFNISKFIGVSIEVSKLDIYLELLYSKYRDEISNYRQFLFSEKIDGDLEGTQIVFSLLESYELKEDYFEVIFEIVDYTNDDTIIKIISIKKET